MRELLGLLVEASVAWGVEQEAADAVLVGAEPEGERLAALLRTPGPHDLRPAADQARAGGAGRFDGALEDHGQERLRVVGRGQRLADECDRLADPLLVSSAPDVGRPPPPVVLFGGRRLGSAAAALGPGDHRSGQQGEPDRGERRDERPAAGLVDRGGDRSLRREHGEADARAFEQGRRDVAVRLAVLLGRALLAGRKRRAGLERPRRRERHAAVADREGLGVEEPRRFREPLRERVVERHAGDDAPDGLVLVEDGDLPARAPVVLARK